MSAEWIAPAVTGFVGIAGIAGTYLTGQSQRRHQQTQALRLEKREIYLRFLELSNKLEQDVRQLAGTPAELEKCKEWKRAADVTRDALYAAHGEVGLTAPIPIALCARLHAEELGRMLHEVAGRFELVDAYKRSTRISRAVLTIAMRDDLGGKKVTAKSIEANLEHVTRAYEHQQRKLGSVGDVTPLPG